MFITISPTYIARLFCSGEMVAMSTFLIYVVIPGQRSGERLLDHWSSGLSKKSKLSFLLSICLSHYFCTLFLLLFTYS